MESSALLRVIDNIGIVDIIRCPDSALVWQTDGSLIWQSDKNHSSQNFAENEVIIAFVNLHIFPSSHDAVIQWTIIRMCWLPIGEFPLS